MRGLAMRRARRADRHPASRADAGGGWGPRRNGRGAARAEPGQALHSASRQNTLGNAQ